ncbi:MAG: GNAT family N-acetyltransferase [Anaerolineae bacterium]|nr:GNAT family N-acetyltransferase [Anaerolineae bacterium]
MSEFHVRPIEKVELPKLLDLYKHLFEKADAPPPPDEQLAQLWDGITTNPLLHYFVGEIDGQIVSSCTMAIIPNLTRGARPYALIENVVTHRAHRKRGYGTQVLRHALQVAWGNGCYKVMLLTGRKDEATLRFYERAGFKPGVKTGFIAYPEE